MNSSDDFEREFRTSRLATGARLDDAYSFVGPDALCRAAIDNYKQFATLHEYHPRAFDRLMVALDRLEVCAERGGTSAEFWLAMKDVAVMDGLYERAATG